MEENMNVSQPQDTNAQQVTPSVQTESQDVNATPSVDNAPVIKVKHLHEEKVLGLDEAVPYVQKGMDYDRVKEKYESTKPALSFLEELAKENGMDVNGYMEAVKEYREQERIRSLAEKEGISEELATRLASLEKKEQEREYERKTYEQQQKMNQQYQEFFEYFAKKNERSFDVAKDTIPDQVWQLVNEGRSLKDAYRIHEADSLEQKVREYETKLNIQQTNQKNAESATGSVTGNGSTTDDFISLDAFNANKNDRNWVVKNLSKIATSRAKW